MIKLHSLRLGFATNSSSTHSLVFFPEGLKVNDDIANGDFGFANFTAMSKETKSLYLAITLAKALISNGLDNDVVKMVCKEWVGIVPSESDYIDHQSLIRIPNRYGSNFPDKQFFEELQKHLLQDRLAILGGNDNDDEVHPLMNQAQCCFNVPTTDFGYRQLTCRKDSSGFWTVFDQYDGKKIRFSFVENSHVFPSPEKADAPELVDLKITDSCPFGCKFCYQNSTKDGKTAPQTTASNMAYSLAELKVFEVAMGGGEPTMVPEFEHILDRYRKLGIVPNFSTKSLDWLRDPKRWPHIIEACGAFALSYSKSDDNRIEELLTLLDYNGIDHKKASLQVIPELMDDFTFRRVLEVAGKNNLRVTLLGYKRKGRGKLVKPVQNTKSILETIHKTVNTPSIGIDTCLANMCQKELEKMKIPRYMYEVKEGKFSCYIDLVHGKIGPSSFCDDAEMMDIDLSGYDPRNIAKNIRQAFSKF